MQFNAVIAGFGGQGVLLTGQLLAYAGLIENKHVAWIPSYGPEMRGGTAHCSVIISDDRIGSPLVEEPGVALVFNRPSLDKFEPLMRPGGILVSNSSIVDKKAERKDLYLYEIPAGETARRLGNDRVANMVMLGACLELTGVVSTDAVMKALVKIMPGKKSNIIDINRKAVLAGAGFVKGNVPKAVLMTTSY